MVTLTCEVCGAAFGVKPYRANTARFCSYQCGGTWHLQNRPNPHPDPTGNKFRAGLPPTNAFKKDQNRGRQSPSWVEPLVFTCEHCQNTFERKPWMVKRGAPRFCSRRCFTASGAFRGEKSATWVGGPTTYRGRGWLAARAKAIERDGGRCQICGRYKGSSIPVHHVIPYREFQTATAANVIENLVCLCPSCHMRLEAGRINR